MHSALIIGGDSTIGRPLAEALTQHGVNVTTTTRKTQNISNHTILFDLAEAPEHWPAFPKTDVAYLCAAATKLDACEDNPQTTHLINVTHMQTLAERLLAQGTYVVFLSTNQVFDGTKPFRRADEPVSPRNAYGRQKAHMEAWLLRQESKAAILRLTKVIAGPLPMMEKWKTALLAGETVQAFTDLRFAALPMESVIAGMVDLGNRQPGGIFQLSGLYEISYYEIACKLAESLNIDTNRVTPTLALDAGIRAQFLPEFGTLDRTTMQHITVIDPFASLSAMVA